MKLFSLSTRLYIEKQERRDRYERKTQQLKEHKNGSLRVVGDHEAIDQQTCKPWIFERQGNEEVRTLILKWIYRL